ncbi:MAG: amidohydrolase family protein, partial [Anaerovoracaceae bacterium]|nr:amidohydrolase family protein [Anaerovoracaceae bacterium]
TAMTRVDPEMPLDPSRYPGRVRPPDKARLSLEELIRGYTVNNAVRMRLDDKMGSIAAGKLANMVVLDRDIYAMPADQIKDVRPVITIFEGCVQKLRDVEF